MIDAQDHSRTTQARSSPRAARPWRKLELRHLFIGIAGVAIALALGTYHSPYYTGAAYSLFLLEVFVATLFFTRRFLFAMTAAIGMVVLPYGLLISISTNPHPHAAYRRNNMRQIMLALKMYERDFGTLPPVYVADADGRPLYSWRVLMLPYLEERTLYEAFHLEEPWNSSHNRAVSGQMPDCFAYSRRQSSGFTPFLIVAGETTLMGAGEPTDVKQLRLPQKELDQTILLIEYPGSDVIWTEPRELSPLAVMNARGRGEFNASPADRKSGVHVGYYDGRVELLGSPAKHRDAIFRAQLNLPPRSLHLNPKKRR
jgi:hypothetical protein